MNFELVDLEDYTSDTYTVVELVVANGSCVIPGQVVTLVETQKAIVDLVAPIPGVITFHVIAGEAIRIGQTLLSIEPAAERDEAPIPENVPGFSITGGWQPLWWKPSDEMPS